MHQRWLILGVLFFARLTMAFQFQSVASLSPLYLEAYAIDLAALGFLIGLYLAPGVFVAVPGSTVAAWFGEKRIVAYAIVLMLIGQVIIVVSGDWGFLVFGRALAGIGGVVLNIVMTKLLLDWFDGKEISTALALFVNSWPVGIAAALLILPLLGSDTLLAANIFTAALIAVGLFGFVFFYRPPPGLVARPTTAIKFASLPYYTLVLAGIIWALYNTALAMVFSFGPTVFTEAGWTLKSSGQLISLFMIVFSLAVPFGGFIADKTGRRDLMIMISLVAFAALMPLIPIVPPIGVAAIFICVGVLFAFAAGPIMTLPSAVLSPENRTFGMGIFFMIYYGMMMVAPRIAGGIADRLGSANVALTVGAVVCVVSVLALVLFRQSRQNS